MSEWPTAGGIGLFASSTADRLLPGFGHGSAPVGIWLVYIGLVFSFSAALQYTAAARRVSREIKAAGTGRIDGGQ